MSRENTDWVAIARSLGHNKLISKQLAFAFSETKGWHLLRDPKFLNFFQNALELEDNTCGSGCCSSQRVVGPNGWVEFYLDLGGKDVSWHISQGHLYGVQAGFQNYPEWLACYRRRRKLIQAGRIPKKA